MNYHEDLYMDVGKSFNRSNMKNMLMISEFVDHIVLDKESISTISVDIDDFPCFTKLDPS